MSRAEIRRRLAKLDAETEHLRAKLPINSRYNHIVKMDDLADYLQTGVGALRWLTTDTPPERCKHGCTTSDHCRLKPPCRYLPTGWQKTLSMLFYKMDANEIVKVRLAKGWTMVLKPPAGRAGVEKVASAEEPYTAPVGASHALKIDLTTLGPPRLKVT